MFVRLQFVLPSLRIPAAAFLGLSLLAGTARADWYVANSGSNTVEVSIQGGDCTFFNGILQVGSRPIGVAVNPSGTLAYVASAGSGTISVISVAARSVIATIPVGGSPFGPTAVAFHPDGSRAYALSNNRVAVIDTATNTVIANVFVIGVANALAVHPDGTRLYVATAAGIVSIIGTSSNLVLANIQVATILFGLAILPDGTRLYAAASNAGSIGSIAVISTANNSVITNVPVDGIPLGSVAANRDGSRVYAVVDRSQNGIPAKGLLAVIDTASNTLLTNLEVGRVPYGVALDRSHIYVTNQFDSNVTVFDAASNATVGLMPVGSIPLGVATFVPPDPPPLPVNVQVTGIEVTQAIQDLNNSVPLVAGRRTFVRVHVITDDPLYVNSSATLFGIRNDCTTAFCVGTPLGSLAPLNNTTFGGSVAAFAGISVTSDPQRSNLNDSFLFELPWAWAADSDKPLRLYAVLDTTGGPPPAGCRPDARSVGVYFDVATSLRIQFIRMAYDVKGRSTPFETSKNEQKASESWLRRAMPLSKLIVSRDWRFYDAELTSRVDRTNKECDALKTAAADDRDQCAHRYIVTNPALMDAAANVDGAYALVPQHPAGMIFSTRGACCTRRLATGPSQGTTYGYYTTHELGHLLGRHHPEKFSSICKHSPDDPNFPYAFALIHPLPYNEATGLAGFDAGDDTPAIFSPRRYLGGFIAREIMSYCDPPNEWVSDYTYLGLYRSLQSLRPTVSASTDGSLSKFGAVPEVATHQAVDPQLGDWLMVLGQISPLLATPAYIQTRRVDRVLNVPPRVGASHSIRLLGAGGNILADYAFTPEVLEDAETTGSTSPALTFAHVVPFVPGTRDIQIVDNSAGSQVIGGKPVSANPPTIGNVAVQGPIDPASETVTVGWTASDPDGDPLTFDVFVVRDGVVPLPLMIGLSGASAQIPIGDLGGGIVRFRVVAADGVHSAFGDTPTLTLANKPPSPNILNPANASTALLGRFINFEGTATDPQDDIVSDANLSWSVPGRSLGAGPRISINDLPVGVHDVTLTATNSLGISATSTIRIAVTAQIVQGPALTTGPQAIGWQVGVGESQLQTADLHIKNSGIGNLAFSVSSTASWLTVNPVAGNAPATITVTGNPAGTAAGITKEANITVAAVGIPEQVITIPVTLSVGNTFAGRVSEAGDTRPCAVNVSTQVSVTRAGIRLNRTTGRYVQQVTIRNAATTPISGPVALVLDGLSTNAALFGKNGDTSCATPVSPYINLSAGADNVLSAGESATVMLEFTNPTNQTIMYSTRVVAGSERR